MEFRQQKVTPATTRKLRITNLILNSPYEVKVQMFNDAGGGPFSDLISVKTKEGGEWKCMIFCCFVTKPNQCSRS